MIHLYPSKVAKYGTFWCVYIFRCNVWQRMRDLYISRKKARIGQKHWKQA